MPVDTAPEPLALTAAAGLEYQIGSYGGIILVRSELLDLALAVIGELLWEMAFFAGLPGRLQLVCSDGKFVSIESSGKYMPHISSLAGDSCGEKSLANMAIDTIDTGMRRS